MKMKRNDGFTLIELMIVIAIFSILMLAVGGIYMSNFNAWRVEENIVAVNMALRTVETQLHQELVEATFTDDVTLNTAALTVGVGTTTFQRPITVDGLTWTNPVTIRLRNEDLNGNLLLDVGEDVDGNGVLDRVVERLVDGVFGGVQDGDFTDPGETRLLARGVDGLVFNLAGNLLTCTITSSNRADNTANALRTDTLTFSVLITN